MTPMAIVEVEPWIPIVPIVPGVMMSPVVTIPVVDLLSTCALIRSDGEAGRYPARSLGGHRNRAQREGPYRGKQPALKFHALFPVPFQIKFRTLFAGMIERLTHVGNY